VASPGQNRGGGEPPSPCSCQLLGCPRGEQWWGHKGRRSPPTPHHGDAGLGCCLPARTAAWPSSLAAAVPPAPVGFGSKAAQLEKSPGRWSDPLTLFCLKMHEMQAAAYGDSRMHARAHAWACFRRCTDAAGSGSGAGRAPRGRGLTLRSPPRFRGICVGGSAPPFAGAV